MEEVSLTETETRYYGDLFLYCDEEKSSKIPILKASELFRSANLCNEKLLEITSLAGIPDTALHISRAQFYSCLKLIAAHQASLPLRQELIATSIKLPLPQFSWTDLSSNKINKALNYQQFYPKVSSMSAIERKNSLKGHYERRDAKSLGPRTNSLSSHQPEITVANSDLPSTDSEFEQGGANYGGEKVLTANSSHSKPNRCGVSPEAWSTNSESPTPTNSVADRPWVKETLWHGLLGDEHRQLLGTEEESSDRHSSDDEIGSDLETVYQITPEQREYYFKQFKAVQLDQSGLLSGHVARVFFEKSRIPVDELRHIWQLCDVTRDGALSLSEFIAAMHLVVLRRNNIPLPASLPVCLQPNVLQHTVVSCTQSVSQSEPPEADLLHLDDDEEAKNTDCAKTKNSSAIGTGVVSNKVANSSGGAYSEKNVIHLNSLSTSSQTNISSREGNQPIALSTKPLTSPTIPPLSNFKHHCASNNSLTPPTLPILQSLQNQRKSTSPKTAEEVQANKWTKFNESPTSNLSSPGPKPVNFDMQRTAQAVVSDPQILHPVPLRVTPVAISSEKQTNETDVCESSPKQALSQTHRDTLQNQDLRPIQRPQAKKIPIKNKGAIPPPPQREFFGGNTSNTISNIDVREDVCSGCIYNLSVSMVLNKKDQPPPPPPRPHRHGRSSSLDLNKLKIGISSGSQSEKTAQTSLDLQSTGFADFTHFGDDSIVISKNRHQSQHPRFLNWHDKNTTSSSDQRISAFEVYRKPSIPQNSHSPTPMSVNHAINESSFIDQPPIPFGAIAATAMKMSTSITTSEQYEKSVNMLNETLRHVSFEQKGKHIHEVLQQLREQNKLLLCLCKNLSDELLSVQTRKEEIRLKLEENYNSGNDLSNVPNISNSAIVRAGSSISAPVTANVTGGSGSSGIHSNV